VAVDRHLPRFDDDLAEQDDEEQPEALGEVVGLERVRRVSGASAARSRSRRRRCMASRSSSSIALDSRTIAIAHRTSRNGPGTAADTANSTADATHARVIRRCSMPARSPPAAYPAASTSRMTARLSAKTVASPVDAGAIATAATPTGTLPARNSSRCAGTSSPWRL
jgi:hypothetical protein